jgi:hypothetical protein
LTVVNLAFVSTGWDSLSVDVSFITETVPWEIEASRGGTSGKVKSTIFRLMKEKGRYVAVASPTAKSALKNAKP